MNRTAISRTPLSQNFEQQTPFSTLFSISLSASLLRSKSGKFSNSHRTLSFHSKHPNQFPLLNVTLTFFLLFSSLSAICAASVHLVSPSPLPHAPNCSAFADAFVFSPLRVQPVHPSPHHARNSRFSFLGNTELPSNSRQPVHNRRCCLLLLLQITPPPSAPYAPAVIHRRRLMSSPSNSLKFRLSSLSPSEVPRPTAHYRHLRQPLLLGAPRCPIPHRILESLHHIQPPTSFTLDR